MAPHLFEITCQECGNDIDISVWVKKTQLAGIIAIINCDHCGTSETIFPERVINMEVKKK